MLCPTFKLCSQQCCKNKLQGEKRRKINREKLGEEHRLLGATVHRLALREFPSASSYTAGQYGWKRWIVTWCRRESTTAECCITACTPWTWKAEAGGSGIPGVCCHTCLLHECWGPELNFRAFANILPTKPHLQL